MTKEIKAGRLLRDFPASDIKIVRDAGKPATLTFPASSENPVERWFGTEILSHAKGAMRTERLDAGAVPLLFNHNWSDPIGMVTGGRLVDGKFSVDATMFATDRAAEVQTMIDGGPTCPSPGNEPMALKKQVLPFCRLCINSSTLTAV